MPEDLDYNTIAAEFVSQNIEKFYDTSKGVIKGAADTIRLRLSKSYKAYLSCVYERYSKVKSFFIRHEPRDLYDFYVPLGVSCGEARIDKASISNLSSISSFLVITGVAGIGKSMMMRHLFLDTIAVGKKVPIFMELRELNQNDLSLREYISQTLSSNHFALDDAYVEKALKTGHFVLFLDGFDEVSLTLRKSLGDQIRKLAKNYDQNIIVVSSRPDHEFSGWESFSVVQTTPLTLKQACELVEKLPFDPELKSKFLKDLRRALFKKHESFLSNPLLLSIMLLTYGMSADIPNKLSVFYNQAYEALFQRHDALKGGYQRDKRSNLDIQDFAKVFASFSVQTYDKRVFQFSRSEALEYLERSKKLFSFRYDSNDYLNDTLQAVCLLVEDGLMLGFSHRSFQEFFAARFIADAKPDIQAKLMDKYSKNLSMDNIMRLLYEMKPEMVEEAYILPTLAALERELGLKRKLGMTHYTRYIKTNYGSFGGAQGELQIVSYGKNNMGDRFVTFVLRTCGHLVNWPGYQPGGIAIKSWQAVKQKDGIQITTNKLTSRHEFIRELAKGRHPYSKEALEYALKVKTALIEKHRSADRSLDEILSI